MRKLLDDLKSWYRMFRKRMDVRSEVKKRGGRAAVNESRSRRQEEIRFVKEGIIKDLYNGLILGDFRIQQEHAAIISARATSIPIEELVRIKKEYRSF